MQNLLLIVKLVLANAGYLAGLEWTKRLKPMARVVILLAGIASTTLVICYDDHNVNTKESARSGQINSLLVQNSLLRSGMDSISSNLDSVLRLYSPIANIANNEFPSLDPKRAIDTIVSRLVHDMSITKEAVSQLNQVLIIDTSLTRVYDPDSFTSSYRTQVVFRAKSPVQLNHVSAAITFSNPIDSISAMVTSVGSSMKDIRHLKVNGDASRVSFVTKVDVLLPNYWIIWELHSKSKPSIKSYALEPK